MWYCFVDRKSYERRHEIIKKIYILVAYSDDGRIVDLGWSTSLNVIREAINSNEVKEQLNELTINTCELKIRDNYYPTNYYGLE